MTKRNRPSLGFASGTLIGMLGGLIGLCGAEFRLPELVELFKLDTILISAEKTFQHAH